MFGTLGMQEMIIIFFVALVLFGPKKLPELGKTIGKALTEFRRASNDLKSTFEREMHTLEREGESIGQATNAAANQIYDRASEIDPYQHWLTPDGTTAENAAETATNQSPETVGASEVAGAESTGTTETAALEGTVPRTGAAVQEEPAPETPQHS